MKIQYLGTAAAEAVPALFCHCEVCRRAREMGGREIRHRSGLVINDRTLIDFPPDIYDQSLRLGLDLGNVDDIFITHSHYDHFDPAELEMRRIHSYCDITDENGQDKQPLRLYGNAGVMHALQTVLSLENPDTSSYLELHVIHHFESVTTPHGLTFTFLPAQHKQDENSGIYLVEDGTSRILYAHDTGAILPEVLDFLQSKPLDAVSFDCCHGAKKGSWGHMGMTENAAAAEALRAVGAVTDKTVLVANHFSHYCGMLHGELEQAAQPLGLRVAYDGMVLQCGEAEAKPLKVRYVGDDNIMFRYGKIYEPVRSGDHWYVVVDELGGEFMYPDHLFERVEE